MTDLDSNQTERLRHALGVLVDSTPPGHDFSELATPTLQAAQPTPERPRLARRVAVAVAAVASVAAIGVVAFWLGSRPGPGPDVTTDGPAGTTTSSTVPTPGVALDTDAVAEALLREVGSDLAIHALDSDEPTQLRLTPSAETSGLSLTPQRLGVVDVDASGRYVWSQPLEDFGGFGGPGEGVELWAGRLDRDQRLLNEAASPPQFHSTRPGLLAWLDLDGDQPVLHTIDLTSGEPPRRVATVPGAVGVGAWSDAGIVVNVSGGESPSVLVGDDGTQTPLPGAVLDLAGRGPALTRTGLIDPNQPQDAIPLDVEGRILHGEWIPSRDAFAVVVDTGDTAELALIDLSGETTAEAELDTEVSPTLTVWEDLVVVTANRLPDCCVLMLWDPDAGQVGRITSAQGLIPIGSLEAG